MKRDSETSEFPQAGSRPIKLFRHQYTAEEGWLGSGNENAVVGGRTTENDSQPWKLNQEDIQHFPGSIWKSLQTSEFFVPLSLPFGTGRVMVMPVILTGPPQYVDEGETDDLSLSFCKFTGWEEFHLEASSSPGSDLGDEHLNLEWIV